MSASVYRQLRALAEDAVPHDPALLERAIRRAVASRARRRRIRWAAATTVGLAAAVALALFVSMWLTRPTAEVVKRPPAPFTKADAQRLLQQCGEDLGVVAPTAETVIVAKDRSVAAAVVRDESLAQMCVRTDAASKVAFVYPVTVTGQKTNKVRPESWTYVRVPARRMFIVSVSSVDLDQISVAFPEKNMQSKVARDDSIGVGLFVPRKPKTEYNFGLYNNNSCLCGVGLAKNQDEFPLLDGGRILD